MVYDLAVEYMLYHLALGPLGKDQKDDPMFPLTVTNQESLERVLSTLIARTVECDPRITCAEQLQLLESGVGTPGEEIVARAKMENASSLIALEVERCTNLVAMLRSTVTGGLDLFCCLLLF